MTFTFSHIKNKKLHKEISFIPILFSLLIIFIIINSCTNPFAPKLSNSSGEYPIISDQKSIDGVFQNFRYAYTFKDTLVYGNLLADGFTFVSYDYDRNVPLAWGRDEDMLTTNGLFRATQNLNLIWNNVINSSTGRRTRSSIYAPVVGRTMLPSSCLILILVIFMSLSPLLSDF